MTVIVEIAVDPIGTSSTEAGNIIVEAVKTIKNMGVKFQVCPMGTCIELENTDELGRVITAVHDAVYKAGVKRIVTTVRIDDRRDKDETMEYKVKRVLEGQL
ncbi:MAG: MTH1187 family thiamine-binding protein [Thaumarchaeota archaeon]|jgi:uncharacterized protein (TIGR00106 family)|nr:MTH1187 family thiamine-binding protein [Nitrososphaerota archaeon]